jgi:KaiC/GvpD/RAD55 family RecA-like ATPase
VPTGIPGFDELVQGGFPKGSGILVTGAPGTGKSIFGLQFMYNGAHQWGESGLYVSFEQSPQELRQQGLLFGWDFEPLEKISKAKFVTIPVDLPRLDVFDYIKEAAAAVGAERIVIDSLSIFGVNAEMYSIPLAINLEEQERQYRMARGRAASAQITGGAEGKRERLVYLFVRKVKDLGATVTYVSDAPPQGSQYWSRDTVSEFACDGVVKLDALLVGTSPVRMVTVHKMRSTRVDTSPHVYSITDGRGITVEKGQG